MEGKSPQPGDPEFVVNRWLHPSMYTAVPDPDWEPGYEQRVRQQAEAQWAALREAQGCRARRPGQRE